MKDEYTVKDEALEGATGGRKLNLVDSMDDDGELHINVKKYTKECIFCGKTMIGKKKGTFIVYTCECGAKYQPGIANPWIEPNK